MYISPSRVDRLLARSPNLSAWAPRVFALLAERVSPSERVQNNYAVRDCHHGSLVSWC